MFKYYPPSDYEVHQWLRPSMSCVFDLQKRREEIIMACLKGGQHINDAIEAADRLIPESKIDEANEQYKKRLDEWMEKGRQINRKAKEKSELKSWRIFARWSPF